MSDTFYTSVAVHGSRILLRGIENGTKIRQKLDYHPTLYLSSKEPTQFTTVRGEYVSEIKPGNIRDSRDFCNQYKGVDNFKIYGNQKYEYAFIADHYTDDIEWNRNLINVANIDIEVGSENGFPEPETAAEPITAITVYSNRGFLVYGLGDFNNSRGDVRYIRCDSEIHLIKSFITDWSLDYPDIITGWNVKFFDIPYLVNRITNLLGEEYAKRLSPWNVINQRTATVMGKERLHYILLGTSTLDYLEIYKKFAPKGQSQESYKLDFICHEELGERKLSYEEYGSLHGLYKQDHQKFIEYNIRDVELVEKLDDKLRLIDLALTLAYDSKSNYDDVISQVRMWDNIIFNHLKKKDKVVSPIERYNKNSAYVGAYVKDPIIGLHKWIASFDLNSLYPHLIMQFNISPDKIVGEVMDGISIDSLLNKEVDTSQLKERGLTVTPNGQLFKVDSQGFLAEIMQTMYNDRSKYKKQAIQAKKDLEKETDELKRNDLQKKISRYNNLQLAKKVSLNSAYGALGNEYFRFYDIRQATAITTSGQLAIRWIERKLNNYLNKLLATNKEDYVIASDTDSIYLCLDKLVRKTIMETNPTAGPREVISFLDRICENKIQPFIDKSFNELAGYTNALDQKMIMKREALADKGIWTAKKRYILNVYNNEGVEYSKPDVKIMGLEMIKSSTPMACRKKLIDSVDILLNKTEDDMIEFIDEFRVEFRKMSPEEIAFPRGVNNVEKYTMTMERLPIHVKGSIIYNNFLIAKNLTKQYQKISDGDKIKFIYLKEPNPYNSHVISFPTVLPKELDLQQYIDYNLQFDKSFLEPLKIILDCIGWRTEKKISLDEFFV